MNLSKVFSIFVILHSAQNCIGEFILYSPSIYSFIWEMYYFILNDLYVCNVPNTMNTCVNLILNLYNVNYMGVNIFASASQKLQIC